MKLCVFQGTFNPIHNAHLKMAEFVLTNYGFDKIIFIPAFKPPHKDCDENTAQHRLKMVQIATKYNPNFVVSDIEYQNNRKSYTYLTIKELYELYDIDGKINFIIGTDAFKKIETWYEIDKLKKLLHFIVFKRENEIDDVIFSRLKSKGYDFEFTSMEFTDISSTQIREKSSIDELVPKEVKEYIEENGLYKNK